MNADQREFAKRMVRPVIGITPEDLTGRGDILLPRLYTDAVLRAGGLPVILPPWELREPADAAALLRRVDGLILAGGGDVAPALYGGAPHPAIYAVDPARDAGELALARAALDAGLPVLGICRGAQIINVALGGTLVEHVPEANGGALAHRAEPPAATYHTVTLAPGSRLAAALGAGRVQVASWHHQAIRTPGPGLCVTAQAEDGVAEGVELAGQPFFVAVQWHPEMTAAADPVQQRLFGALVEQARQYADERRSKTDQSGLNESTHRGR